MISTAETLSPGLPSPVYIGSAEGKEHRSFEFNAKFFQKPPNVCKVSRIFNYSYLIRNILSTLRESWKHLEKCSKRFRFLLWRWRVTRSIDTGGSVKNCSRVSTCSPAIVMREKYMLQKICAPVQATVYKQAPYLLKVWIIKYIFLYATTLYRWHIHKMLL